MNAQNKYSSNSKFKTQFLSFHISSLFYSFVEINS